MINNLVGVCKTTHTTHDTKDIVVGSVHTNFGSCVSTDSGRRKNQLKSSVIDSTEITGSRWLVFFRAKSERVNVNTRVWVAGVALEWLNNIEVGTFTFTESVLTVQLKFTGNYWVLSPTV